MCYQGQLRCKMSVLRRRNLRLVLNRSEIVKALLQYAEVSHNTSRCTCCCSSVPLPLLERKTQSPADRSFRSARGRRSHLYHLSSLSTGTLHVGSEATPHAVDAFQRLRAARVPIRFCSNTTKDGSQALLDRLKGIGFDIRDHEVYLLLIHSRLFDSLSPVLRIDLH